MIIIKKNSAFIISRNTGPELVVYSHAVPDC